MPLNPGNQTFTFNPPGRFVVDKYHKVPASAGLSSFSTGPTCNKQAAGVKDKVDNTAYSEATDKIYAPYNANTATVDAEWYAVDSAGIQYRVIGTHFIPDGWGRVFQCLFICKKEEG